MQPLQPGKPSQRACEIGSGDLSREHAARGREGAIFAVLVLAVLVFGLVAKKEVEMKILTNTDKVLVFANSSVLDTILYSDLHKT